VWQKYKQIFNSEHFCTMPKLDNNIDLQENWQSVRQKLAENRPKYVVIITLTPRSIKLGPEYVNKKCLWCKTKSEKNRSKCKWGVGWGVTSGLFQLWTKIFNRLSYPAEISSGQFINKLFLNLHTYIHSYIHIIHTYIPTSNITGKWANDRLTTEKISI
jgi:hypothetical protein